MGIFELQNEIQTMDSMGSAVKRLGEVGSYNLQCYGCKIKTETTRQTAAVYSGECLCLKFRLRLANHTDRVIKWGVRFN